MKYRISRRADKDLEAICDYVAEANPDAAERLDGQIHDAIKKPARFPGMGHARSDVKDKRYLFWAVGKYIIAYRVEKELFVVRIVHGARDLRKIFKRRK